MCPDQSIQMITSVRILLSGRHLEEGKLGKTWQKKIANKIITYRRRGSMVYIYDHKFVQNIDQHLLESITASQKNSAFHEEFDSISGFLSASKSYGLLTPCTNFCVSL